MKKSMIVGLAVVVGLAASSALAADNCKKDAAAGPVVYCGVSVFSSRLKGEYNVNLGPGNALSGAGIPGTNTQGFTISGDFTCPGNDFFTINDTSNQGDNNVIYGRFSSTRPATGHGFDSFNGLVFSLEMTPGACQVPPRAAPAKPAGG